MSAPRPVLNDQNFAALRYCAEHGDLPDWFHRDPTSVVLALLDRAETRKRHLQKEPVDLDGANEKYPEVARFAKVMLRQLARHGHKGDQPGWLRDYPNDLILGAYRELWELQETVRHKPREGLLPWLEQIAEDAADVANFAMMVADNIEHRIIPDNAFAAQEAAEKR